MAKKLLKTLVNNLGFKILAVALAFILWLVVYNIDDPKKTKTYTTNVTVENAAVVTDMNKCYEVLNGTNTVTFSVTGKRSELDKLDDTDFTAVADMNRLIVSADGDKASVPIEINTKRSFGALSINSKNKYLELEKEYKAEVEKMYNLIKDVSQLTLCWNNATVGDTFVEGDNVNSDVNINQFLNCCGDVIASEAGIVDQANSNIGELKQSIKDLATRLTKGETSIEEVDEKLNALKTKMIIIIVVIVILFLMIGFLTFKIQFAPTHLKGSSFDYNSFKC